MYLFIDVQQEAGIVLKLLDRARVTATRIESGDRKVAQRLLVLIDEFLTNQGVKVSDLAGIVVVNDSESFTTARLVVTMVNTLQQLIGIPTFGDRGFNLDTEEKIIEATKKVKRGVFIVPYYDREPNITVVS